MVKWSESTLKKDLSEFSSVGKAFKVQLKFDDTFYNCCYIIIETSKSYLWIDLTATRETYDIDFKKLEDIMLKFSTYKRI